MSVCAILDRKEKKPSNHYFSLENETCLYVRQVWAEGGGIISIRPQPRIQPHRLKPDETGQELDRQARNWNKLPSPFLFPLCDDLALSLLPGEEGVELEAGRGGEKEYVEEGKGMHTMPSSLSHPSSSLFPITSSHSSFLYPGLGRKVEG